MSTNTKTRYTKAQLDTVLGVIRIRQGEYNLESSIRDIFKSGGRLVYTNLCDGNTYNKVVDTLGFREGSSAETLLNKIYIDVVIAVNRDITMIGGAFLDASAERKFLSDNSYKHAVKSFVERFRSRLSGFGLDDMENINGAIVYAITIPAICDIRGCDIRLASFVAPLIEELKNSEKSDRLKALIDFLVKTNDVKQFVGAGEFTDITSYMRVVH